jgi:hypothetical protein
VEYVLRKIKLIVLLGLVTLLSEAALAQEFGQPTGTWTDRMDRATSGAAASVLLHLGCTGQAGAAQAVSKASKRLGTLSQEVGASFGVAQSAVWAYAYDAYSLKVKAIWSANAGHACTDLGRLRDLAASTGFATPD